MLLNRFFEFEKKKQQQNVGINMNDILILYRWILKLYTAILRAKIIGARWLSDSCVGEQVIIIGEYK